MKETKRRRGEGSLCVDLYKLAKDRELRIMRVVCMYSVVVSGSSPLQGLRSGLPADGLSPSS